MTDFRNTCKLELTIFSRGVLMERTHAYMECPLPDGRTRNVLAPDHDGYGGDCEECEQYYREEMHMETCDPDCAERQEELQKCVGCTCDHCKGEYKWNR